jgi:hypothetical protein
MNQRGPLHPLANAITFCVPTTLVRRALSKVGLRRYVTRGVDNDIDVTRDAFGFLFGETQIGLGNVTANNRNLVANEIFERRAVAFTHRIERLGRNRVVQNRVSDSSCERARTVT